MHMPPVKEFSIFLSHKDLALGCLAILHKCMYTLHTGIPIFIDRQGKSKETLLCRQKESREKFRDND